MAPFSDARGVPLFLAPKGSPNSSHGWSEAEPVVNRENVPVPGGGEQMSAMRQHCLPPPGTAKHN